MSDAISTDPAGPTARRAGMDGLLAGFLAIFAAGFVQVGTGLILREQAQDLDHAGWRFLDSRESPYAIVLIGLGLLVHRDLAVVLFLGLVNAALGYGLLGSGLEAHVGLLLITFSVPLLYVGGILALADFAAGRHRQGDLLVIVGFGLFPTSQVVAQVANYRVQLGSWVILLAGFMFIAAALATMAWRPRRSELSRPLIGGLLLAVLCAGLHWLTQTTAAMPWAFVGGATLASLAAFSRKAESNQERSLASILLLPLAVFLLSLVEKGINLAELLTGFRDAGGPLVEGGVTLGSFALLLVAVFMVSLRGSRRRPLAAVLTLLALLASYLVTISDLPSDFGNPLIDSAREDRLALIGIVMTALFTVAILLAGAGAMIEAQRRLRPLMVAFVLGLVPLAANLIFNATAPALRPTPWSWEVDDSARSIIFWLSSALGLIVIAALFRWRADDRLPPPEETPVVDSTEVF